MVEVPRIRERATADGADEPQRAGRGRSAGGRAAARLAGMGSALLAGVVGGTLVAPAAAQPATMPVQGLLRDNAGNVVEQGRFRMTFRLYGPNGEAELFSETHGDGSCGTDDPAEDCVAVHDGVFSVQLGSETDGGLDPALFHEEDAQWLGISVEGEPELPLQSVGAAGRALSASVSRDLSCSGCVDGEHLEAPLELASPEGAEVALDLEGRLAMNDRRITGLGEPGAADDATTKGYVDANAIGGLDCPGPATAFYDGAEWRCADRRPAPLPLRSRQGVPRGETRSSEPVRVTDVSGSVPVEIAGPASAAYRICTDGSSAAACGGSVEAGWGSDSRSIEPGQFLQLRMKSASAFQTTRTAALNVGSGGASWSLTTEAADRTPNDFDFDDRTDASLGATVTTEAVTIQGINAETPVSFVGATHDSAELSIGGEAWTTSGSVNPGETLRLRLTASPDAGESRSATVEVGGVTATWSVTSRPGHVYYGCDGTNRYVVFAQNVDQLPLESRQDNVEACKHYGLKALGTYHTTSQRGDLGWGDGNNAHMNLAVSCHNCYWYPGNNQWNHHRDNGLCDHVQGDSFTEGDVVAGAVMNHAHDSNVGCYDVVDATYPSFGQSDTTGAPFGTNPPCDDNDSSHNAVNYSGTPDYFLCSAASLP